ncbi:hypothetical protein DL98DRAFT_593269 [Cadophora sp. DSE1049]|nr:hypothetical protein DL98DRAFT_593269 [Cadophora sp. DSE1049]
MAETLGAVASGFAVVSLAIQVTETIHKLKSFYSLMQSAPADILFAIEELETLSGILEDVDRSVQEQVFLDPRIKVGVMKSYRLCKAATAGLVVLVGGLEDSLRDGKGKTRAKFGVAMKKGEIEEFRKKIESAKVTMQLANQIYYQAVQSQIWKSLEQDILELQRSHERHQSTIEREVVQIRSFVLTGPYPRAKRPKEVLGSVNAIEVEEEGDDRDVVELSERQSGIRPRRNFRPRSRVKNQAGISLISGLLSITLAANEHDTVTSLYFGLPKWIYARRFELRLMKSRQGWDQSFRWYRMVSYDAKVFDYCMHGDVAGLQRLFSSGEASPFEIDPDGRTPLHYAALYARPEVCKLLVEHGADANARTVWQGQLSPHFWGNWGLDNGRGRYHDADDIPGTGKFRGWPAYSTPLHLLLNTGQVLTANGRQVLNREYHQMSRETTVSQDFEKTIEVLVTFGTDTMLADQYSRTAIHTYTGPSLPLGWLARESECEIKTMPQQDYVGLILSQSLNYRTNGAELCRQLVTKEVLQTIVNVPYNGLFLLDTLVTSWSLALQMESPSLPSLESLIIDVIHAGADLYSVSYDGYTPILCLLDCCYWIQSRPCSQRFVVQKWLDLLDRAGVDLVEYGRIENEMYDNYKTEWTFGIKSKDRGHDICRFELLELRFGETPADFYIEFEDLYASTPLAADFWDWVEAPSDEEKIKAIPGTWKDD